MTMKLETQDSNDWMVMAGMRGPDYDGYCSSAAYQLLKGITTEVVRYFAGAEFPVPRRSPAEASSYWEGERPETKREVISLCAGQIHFIGHINGALESLITIKHRNGEEVMDIVVYMDWLNSLRIRGIGVLRNDD